MNEQSNVSELFVGFALVELLFTLTLFMSKRVSIELCVRTFSLTGATVFKKAATVL